MLDREESAHCVKVLRHRPGDEVTVVDGKGTMYRCRLEDDSLKGARATVLETVPGWGTHPYSLTMAVCPTKNNDRYEWFAEKATELGVDRIVPVIGERSERKGFKSDRVRKIVLSAMKQSLKATLPAVEEPLSVRDFILSCGEGLKLICYCFEGETERRTVTDVFPVPEAGVTPQVTVLIGPEGDFSPAEAELALEQALFKGSAHAHGLAGGLHLGAQGVVGIGEFVEGETGHLGDHIVKGRFEGGAGIGKADFIQGHADTDFRGYPGDGVSAGF